MEKRIQRELDILRDIILKTVPVEKIYLFGSYANGEPNADSDLDLYVVMPENAEVREIDAMRLIHRAIRDQKSLPVDVVVGKSGKFDIRKAAPTIERTISQEGIVLYGG